MPISSGILSEILEKANQSKVDVNVALDFVRRQYLLKLSEKLGMPVIIYAANFYSSSQENTNITLKDVHSLMGMLKDLPKNEVCLFIHSPGGSFEATDGIVQYLTSNFKAINAIVPLHAFSCATLLACACKKIYMGKQSSLGPIDPQIPFVRTDGSLCYCAAQTILDQFEEAKRDCLANPRKIQFWTQIIQQYAPALPRTCEVAIERSYTMASEWLHKYQGIEKGKACEIASWLVDQKKHNSHGKPLCFKDLKDKGLNVSLLEEDNDLQEYSLSLLHAVMFTLNGKNKIIENSLGSLYIE